MLFFTLAFGSFALYAPSAWADLRSGQATDPVERIVMVMVLGVSVLAVGLVVTVIVAAIKYPRLFTRSVLLTPAAVTTPSVYGRKVPLEQICGVGLVLQRMGARPGGMWMLTLWTVDGRMIRAGTIQREREQKHVDGTRVWAAAKIVHAYVLQHQGDGGPLDREERQRQVRYGPFSMIGDVRDPSGV